MPCHLDDRLRQQIHTYAECGLSQAEISKRTSVPQCTVSRVLSGPITPTRRRFQNKAVFLRTPIRKRLATCALLNRFTPWHQLAKSLNITATRHQIRQALQLEGLGRFRSRLTPKTSDLIRQRRINFCLQYQHWTIDQWKRVIFTDESAFRLNHGKIWVTRKNSETCNQPGTTTSRDRGVHVHHVWGALTSATIGPLVHWDRELLGTWTAQNYCVHIVPVMTQCRVMLEQQLNCACIIQQDNAPCHSALLTRQRHTELGNQLLNWPAYSPDLNLIENIWGYLKVKLAYRNPDTEEQLVELLTSTWQNLSLDYINALYSSMPRRIAAVLANEGYPIDY